MRLDRRSPTWDSTGATPVFGLQRNEPPRSSREPNQPPGPRRLSGQRWMGGQVSRWLDRYLCWKYRLSQRASLCISSSGASSGFWEPFPHHPTRNNARLPAHRGLRGRSEGTLRCVGPLHGSGPGRGRSAHTGRAGGPGTVIAMDMTGPGDAQASDVGAQDVDGGGLIQNGRPRPGTYLVRLAEEIV